MKQVSVYHKLLRVSAVVCALILTFDSGLLSPVSRELSDNTVQYLAQSVGMFAQVEPTQLNQYTAELTAKEQELQAREAALEEREIVARDFNTAEDVDYSIYILSIILFILTVLIVLNYVMDWSRTRTTVYASAR